MPTMSVALAATLLVAGAGAVIGATRADPAAAGAAVPALDQER